MEKIDPAKTHMVFYTNPYVVHNSDLAVWYSVLVFFIVLVPHFPKKKEKI
jgi:hypothetical protein